MDLQTSKIELAKLILNLENPSIISKVKELVLGSVNEASFELSNEEKEEIELAISQLNRGERTSFSDYLKKVS